MRRQSGIDRAKGNMGKLTDELLILINKQVQDHGIVIWYDPEGVYGDVAAKLDLAAAQVLRFGSSFFELRSRLAPGSLYTASVDVQGKVGLYRIEVGCSPGTGKLKIAGGIEGPMRESINRAFAYLSGHKVAMGIGQQVDTTDFHAEGIDLLANRVPCECGVALIVAITSAVKKHSVLPALLVLGDLSIQGNIKSLPSLAEPLQVAMDNGARRALIPLENKRNFLDVSGDIVERVDPVFFSDPTTASMKALGMN
jgi:ATP-dependent Lon protease